MAACSLPGKLKNSSGPCLAAFVVEPKILYSLLFSYRTYQEYIIQQCVVKRMDNIIPFEKG